MNTAEKILNKLIYEVISKPINNIGESMLGDSRAYRLVLNPWLISGLAASGIGKAVSIMDEYFPDFKMLRSILPTYDDPDEKEAWNIITRIMIPRKWTVANKALAFLLVNTAITSLHFSENDLLKFFKDLGYGRTRAYKKFYHYFIKSGYCIEEISKLAIKTGHFNILSELVEYNYNLDSIRTYLGYEELQEVAQR